VGEDIFGKPLDRPDLVSSIVAAEACLLGRLRLFVDFANARPSLAVGAELGAAVRLLLTTPSVANQATSQLEPGTFHRSRMLVFTAWNLGIDVSSDGVVPAWLFVDFANVRPSLAVGAELGTVVRLLLTTPRVAKFVELINDGGDIRDLGTALASDPSLEMIRGGSAMNRLDDNDVITHIIHHGTGNLLDIGIGKRGHASKILASDVDSAVVEVESGGETENIRPHAWSLLPVDTSRPQVSSKTSRLRKIHHNLEISSRGLIRKAPPLLSPRATKHGPVAAVRESLYHSSPLEPGKLVNLDIDVTSDVVVPATVFTVSYRTHDRPEQTYRT
jgi:hypothetical protein